MQDKPSASDYLALFGRYRENFGDVYKEADDERFRLLFEQVCTLLVRPSPFNLGLPGQFRATASRWLDGDGATVAHMGQPENRHFMLSDLYDYIHLVERMGGSWEQSGR